MAGLSKVLGKELKSELIGFPYYPLSVLDPNNFRVHEMLPGLLYVMRYGRRRGRGRWTRTYLPNTAQEDGRTRVTVRDVAATLSGDCETIQSFNGSAGEEILADWIAAVAVQTRRGTGEIDDPVQWVRPLHYLGSWVDLPGSFHDFRGTPELLVALLTDASPGQQLPANDRGPFSVAANPDDNLLLSVLGRGVRFGDTANTEGDSIDPEQADTLDPDELLCAIIGGHLGGAPDPQKGANGFVPVYSPLCPTQGRQLRDDLSVLLRAYHGTMPSSTIVEYVCSMLCVNLTTYWICHVITANELYRHGYHREKQASELSLFFDAAGGTSDTVRQLAENSISSHHEIMASYVRTTVGFRLLDRLARAAELSVPDAFSDTIGHLEALASLRLDNGAAINPYAKMYLMRLREKLGDEASLGEEVADLLEGNTDLSPTDRLTEVLIRTQSELTDRVRKFFTGCTGGTTGYGIVRTRGVRPPVPFYSLTDPAIEALVHTNCVKRNKTLAGIRMSLRDFLSRLQEQYGLTVAHASDAEQGGRISHAANDENLAHFKERLRMLGLLRDVSDAEAMLTLELTYPPSGGFRRRRRRHDAMA